jgi:hypothetical protein
MWINDAAGSPARAVLTDKSAITKVTIMAWIASSGLMA